MYIAIPGMHMQRDKHAALEHAIMHSLQLRQYRRKVIAPKQALEFRLNFFFPGNTQRVILYDIKHPCLRLSCQTFIQSGL